MFFQKFLGFFFPDGPDKSFEEGYNWLLERRIQHAATHRLRSASAASSRFSRISFVCLFLLFQALVYYIRCSVFFISADVQLLSREGAAGFLGMIPHVLPASTIGWVSVSSGVLGSRPRRLST
jgi:hypothetical protein